MHAAHPFLLSVHFGDVHYSSTHSRTPLETDILFCSSILYGGDGGGARVREPLSPRPPLFLRPPPPPPPPPREALQAARPSRRRLLVFSVSVPSAVGREPRVLSGVLYCEGWLSRVSSCHSQTTGRGITRERDNRRQLRKLHVRDVPQSFLRNVTDDTRGTSSNLTRDSHMSDSVGRM